jgi:hypothetical protein
MLTSFLASIKEINKREGSFSGSRRGSWMFGWEEA